MRAIFLRSGRNGKAEMPALGKRLRDDGPEALDRTTPTDFERREDIRYVTSDGVYVISYAKGFPVGRFEASTK